MKSNHAYIGFSVFCCILGVGLGVSPYLSGSDDNASPVSEDTSQAAKALIHPAPLSIPFKSVYSGSMPVNEPTDPRARPAERSRNFARGRFANGD